jgi:thymidylate kinase
MSDAIEPPPGLVMAFDGLDGAGKSTQCQILAEKFEARGWPCRILRLSNEDPVERMLADVAVDLPVSVVGNRYSVIAKLLCRQEWLVRPQLEAGNSFIYDKYLLSFLSKELAGGAEASELRTMIRHLEPPDISVFLDVSPEKALERKRGVVTYREAGLSFATYNDEPVSPARFSRGEYPPRWVHQCYLDYQGRAREARARLLADASGYWGGKFGRSAITLSSTREPDDLAAAIWTAVERHRTEQRRALGQRGPGYR